MVERPEGTITCIYNFVAPYDAKEAAKAKQVGDALVWRTIPRSPTVQNHDGDTGTLQCLLDSQHSWLIW